MPIPQCVGNYAWDRSGRLFLYVHGRGSPSASDWERMLADMRGIERYAGFRVLCYTQGGMPNAAQRQTLAEFEAALASPTAFISSNHLARFAGWAMSVFNPNIRFFGARDFERACDHLELRPKEREYARSRLAALCVTLGLSWRPPVAPSTTAALG